MQELGSKLNDVLKAYEPLITNNEEKQAFVATVEAAATYRVTAEKSGPCVPLGRKQKSGY